MIIKKYIGKTEEEATALAKKELGQGVVIMNVRPVKSTGFLSFLKAQKIEVTVALEEETRPPRVLTPDTRKETNAAAAGAQTHTVKPAPEVPAQPAAGALARAVSEGKIPPLRVSGETEKVPAPAPAPPVQAPPVREESILAEESAQSKVLAEKLDTLNSLLEQRIVGGSPAPSGIDRTKQELPEKTEEADAPETPEQAAPPANEAEDDEAAEEALSFIRLLYNTLLENEVDELFANDLTDEIEKLTKPNMSLDYALASVYQKMVLKFGRPETIQPSENAARAEIFIGPTGVGKTTTIAKLASKLHLQDKKKVVLLTVDTYRIAAAEQLRTYASIMETPFRVIYSVEEMKQAIDDFADYDYIMVDTAGHSLHNEEQKENIASFIQAVQEEMDSDTFLVLSATTKYRDLIEISEAYAKMVNYRLIFTKMDETGATGNLYNIRLRTGAPMSYITNGQDVPDDIEVFNPQKIVRALLGGSS